MNQIRNFEGPDPPSDEPNIRSPEESRSEVLELFNFESNVTLQDEAEDDLDRQDDEEEEENSRIDEEHGDFGEIMDDPVPPTFAPGSRKTKYVDLDERSVNNQCGGIEKSHQQVSD
jgi:hypothetical protein